VPAAGRPVSTSHPDHVIGDGTPAGCTSQAVVAAVAAGGVITFNCGPRPVTITMEATAEVRNTSRRVVLDGGGMVALSGGGARRILYMNTCDQALGTATSDCFNQPWPRLIVQNMTFRHGSSTAQQTNDDFGGPSGGGAIFDLRHRPQPGPGGGRRHLLRQQQPDRDADHRGLRAPRRPQRRLRDRRLPGHLLHRPGPPGGDLLDPRLRG
jgi:hypothetical protein